jgi:hypothetical protein
LKIVAVSEKRLKNELIALIVNLACIFAGDIAGNGDAADAVSPGVHSFCQEFSHFHEGTIGQQLCKDIPLAVRQPRQKGGQFKIIKAIFLYETAKGV